MISDKLYELAFEYKKRKLWKILWDLQLFGVKLSDGRIGYISIMGAAGEHCALGLYVGDEGMESFRTIARANRYQLSPLEFQEHLLQQNCLQCAFEGKNELSEQELEEARAYARAHDIRISGKNAYPQFVKYQSNHYPWHLQTEQEQELLCQALQAAIELSEILKSTTPIALGLAPVNDLTEEILMLEPGEKGFVLTSTKLPCIKPKKWPAPKAGNDIGIASLKRMERMGVWECELLRFPEPVRNKPEEIPYFPIILLAVESSTNYILPVPPVEHYEDNPEELLNLFMESLQQQKICPDRIKVRDQRTAAFVKAFCSRLKITVSMEKELPALETAEADFLKHFSMSEEEEMDEMIQMMETILELNKEQVESLPENMVEQIDMILEQGILPEELEWKVRRLLHPELADNRPDKSAFRTVKSGRDHSYVISVSLGTGCYRHIRISGRSTLWDLHSIILEAFGFDDDHAHAFFMDNVQWSRRNCYFMRDMEMEYDGPSTEECSLDRAGLCKEKQFKFLFDFGDEWLFQCKVLRVLKEGTEEPEVIKSKGEAPKQYPDWEEIGISQKELAGGLLSIPELSRLEKGEKTADKVLLEALFQRLGKSLDKLETAMSQEEYQIVFLRTCMLESLIKKDHRCVEALLGEYRLCTGEQKVLHRQFQQMMQAVDRYVQNHIAEECMEALTQALELTVPKWKPEKGRRYYLCVQEIRILLLICYLMMETEYFKTAENYLEVLFQYLEDHYTDGEEKAKIYPQCAWLLTEIYLKQNETGKAYKICRQGKACLVQNGVLTLMEEFLKLEIKCLKKLEKAEEQPELVHELEAIQFLSQFAGEKPPLEKVCYFLMTSQQSEVVISNEMIREFRLAQHLSQEALSADICTQETLSRIESGKRSPNRNNLYAMMERMGSERKTYYGFIVADDYSLYEKVRLFKREASRGRNEEAHVLLQELEESLDRNILLNRQFLETAWLQEQWSTGRISEEHAIQKLEELLQYTMKEYDGEIHRIPFRQEFVILNQIARCMRRSGNVRGATDLYKQILGRYGNSRVLKQHHAVSLFLLYINYTGYLEVENRLEEAELIGREGIRLTMDCQRGDIAGKIMGNLSCVYEKKDGQENEVLAETCMRYSYYILKLYEDDFEHTKEYYQQKYETGRH